MGFFDNRTNLQKKIEEINTSNSLDLNIEEISPYLNVFGEEELLLVLVKLVHIEDYYRVEYMEHLENVANIYRTVVRKQTPEEIRTYKELFDIYCRDYEFLKESKVIERVGNLFDNKAMVLEIFRFLANNEDIRLGNNTNKLLLIEYLEETRQYYVDDRAFFTAFISFVNNVDPAKLRYGKEKDLKREINKKVREAKKANGIYDIGQAELLEMSRKIEALDLSAEKLQTLIDSAEQERASLQDASKNHLAELTELRIKELKALQDEANNITQNFNASYRELLNQEKETIISERDLLIGEIDREISQRKTSILGIADTVGQRVGMELRRIRNASQDSIERIETFLSSNEEVKKLIGEAKTSEEFLSKLKQVEALVQQPGIVVPTGVVAQTPQGSILDGLTIPSFVIPSEREVNGQLNYYFDKKIPYKDRFNELMEMKAKLIEEGAIFHEKFDDILTMILQNDAPYMYGPSGCGKTYMIQSQLAKLLGIDVVTNGYVLYEQDILGYTNSGTGGYVPSNFYRCYKFGDIIFFDELDNGIANATTVLNSFLTGSDTDRYVFPNGEQVARHPNFRIVAAGNTKGTGKTLAHNTRQKMDESVMQRLTPVEINYDNRIEEQILRDYPGWYDFAINFRHAIESIPSESGGDKNSIGTFTTRDAQSVKKYKDDDAMTDEQLIDYEIIENKDIDYLNQILKKMNSAEKSGEFTTEEGRKLLLTFREKVEGMR